MQRVLQLFEYIDRVLARVLYGVGMLAFGLFVVLIVYQVASRNVGVLPVIQWTEEISRFSFMWMVMLGAIIGVLRSDHFLIDIFENRPGARRFTRWLREILILLVGVVFIVGGYDFGVSGARRISMAAGIPMSYIYILFFVMGVFTTFFTIHRLLILFTGSVSALDRFDEAAPIVSSDATDESQAGALDDPTTGTGRG